MRLFALLLIPFSVFAQQPQAADMPQEMLWVDRTGKILGRVGAVQNSMFFPELSPDGRSIAVSARDGEANDRDVWIHDVATGSKRVVAPAKGNDNFPLWSPDGKSLIFTSSRPGGYDLYRKSLDPDQPEERILELKETSEYPRSWSPDGKTLIFTLSQAMRELTLLDLATRTMKPIFPKSKIWRDGARYSPNGKFVAFSSNEDGPFEVFVMRPEDPARVWKVSRGLANGWGGGGGQVRWRADGKELFYIMGNDTLLSIETDVSGETPQFKEAKRLFALPAMRGNFPEEAPWLAKYDVTADGQKFVFVRTIPK